MKTFPKTSWIARLATIAAFLVFVLNGFGNNPGGGTGTGANVTLTSTSTTATMGNGVVSILCTKAGATINQINYTYSNGSGSTTTQLLSGGHNGGQLYWELGGFGGSAFTYSVVVDPAMGDANHVIGDYAEIALLSTSATAGTVEVHFSMRRGSPGFYVTAVWSHRAVDASQGMGETRTNIYVGGIFNWMSVDATRNKLMEVSGASSITTPTAPAECTLWTSGIYNGLYEDKYKFSAPFGTQRVWGWSSVGSGKKNVGIWDVSASAEYYNGGPMKQELMCHIGSALLNMFNGSHYGMGTDGSFAAGEVWNKVYGPYFVYCNNVSDTLTDPVQASQALYNDALAQGAAEATAWPYSWLVNSNYTPATNRGSVTGKMVINDSYNPKASAANMWVGVVQQPVTSTSAYDFQQWMKPYQFWVQTDAAGNFTVPDVIAGSNYTLYAFGPGAAGTFQSQSQAGGNPPLLYNLPATPFGVTVPAGGTADLGSVVWTPTRVGPSVFEIGYPDRTGRKFRHGEDWWVGDVGASPTAPSPVWTKFLEFPFDFPNGPNYTVGTSRWPTDWNFIQPVKLDNAGNWNATSSTITFSLASTPANGSQGSLCVDLASDYYGALIVSVNGVNLGNTSGVISVPGAHPSTGFVPSYSKSDSSIREGTNGMYSSQRITFPASLLHSGTNTITLGLRQVGGSYFANHAMYDYVRLELGGYVPPAPSGVNAYAGNGKVLLSWPTVPGAISYNILRSTTSGSGYAVIATGVTGPVCGSGPTHVTWVDDTASNGIIGFYVVQSVNPVNASANSPQSAGVAPSSGAESSAPAVPTGLVATPSNSSVVLNWTASSAANLYTVKRSTLVNNGGGTYNNLGTITLANAVTGTSYTDTSPTNGSIYSYTVAATNAAGTSASASSAVTIPLAPAPAAAPGSFTATALQTADAGKITLGWAAVSGATGYVIQRATAAAGPYAFLASVSPTTYTNTGLAGNATYYYQIATTNSGGTSVFVSTSAITPPAAPTNLVATPGSSKVTLSWTASSGATSYVIGRATVTGGPYTTIASGIASTTYQDTAAVNGITYFYVIAATGVGGTGLNSVEASATPIGVPSLTWNGNVNTSWDTATANWLAGGGSSLFANGSDVTFDDTATAKTVVISGTVTPNSVLFDNDTAYAFTAAGLSGAAAVTKLGTGAVTVSGVNTYSGGTTIGAGSIVIAGATAANLQSGLGSGAIALQGGTLTLNGYTGSTSPTYGNLSNALSVPAGSSGTVRNSQRGGITGNLTGDGALTLQVNYIRGDIGGDWSAFTGNINVLRTRTGTNVDNFRINSNTGFGTAAINLGPYVQASTVLNANNTFTIGELTGGATSQLAGVIYNNNPAGAYTATYLIGGRDTDATFSGAITNGGSPSITAITKEGVGNWTLTGACTYSGATNITGGTLTISGSLANTGSVSVQSGAFLTLNGGTIQSANIQVLVDGELDGSGTFTGPLTSAGTIVRSPGGNLSVNGNVTNTGEIQFTTGSGISGGLMAVNGNLSLGGTVQITLAPGTGIGRYPLFAYTGSLTSLTATLSGIPGGTAAQLSTTVPGHVDLIIDDSDEDGLPDSWEMQYLGNLSTGPSSDPDGDGQTNAIELLAGTNPGSGSSLFAATMVALNSTQLALTWPSVPGKSYQIQTSGTPAWNWILLTTVPAAASPATLTGYTVTKASATMFYRVVIVP